MIVGLEKYNLKNVLNAYEEHIRHEYFMPVKENSKFQESKEKIGKMAMQVIAIGVGQLTKSQEKTLIDFSDRHFARIPNDPVVHLSWALARVILVVQRLNRLPDDVSVVIQSFREITTLNFLTEKEKKKVASYAANKILQAGESINCPNFNPCTEIVPRWKYDHEWEYVVDVVPAAKANQILQAGSLNCADWARLTKIITFGWNELQEKQEALVKKLDVLTNYQTFNLGATSFQHIALCASAREFYDLAIALNTDYMENYVPKEIKTHLAYHGEALKFGFSKLQEIRKQTGNFNISLKEFTLDYEGAMLKNNQFLIRNHFLLTSHKYESGMEFFLEISWRNAVGDKKSSGFNCTKNAKGEISISMTETFQSLDHLIRRCYGGLEMCVAPSHKTVAKYVSDKYNPIPGNAAKRKKLN